MTTPKIILGGAGGSRVHQGERPTARELVLILRRNGPSPDEATRIESLSCGTELQVGLHLLNGSWEKAHRTVQPLLGPLAAHWHGILHRREPDYPNAKYWYARVEGNSIFKHLLDSASASGHAHQVTTGEFWDPFKFIDACADPGNQNWTRILDQLEADVLLDYCLELEE